MNPMAIEPRVEESPSLPPATKPDADMEEWTELDLERSFTEVNDADDLYGRQFHELQSGEFGWFPGEWSVAYWAELDVERSFL